MREPSMTNCAVVFDAVGTLIHPEPSAAKVYAEVGRRFGSAHDLPEIKRRFAEAFGQQEAIDRQNQWLTSEDRELRRWQDIVAEVLDDVSDAADCFQTLYRHFGQPEAWRLDPQTEAVFAGLKNRGCRLALASNLDHRLHRLIAGIAPLGRMDAVIISSEVGHRKPAHQFFEAVSC